MTGQADPAPRRAAGAADRVGQSAGAEGPLDAGADGVQVDADRGQGLGVDGAG
jgi:hypothetical protein